MEPKRSAQDMAFLNTWANTHRLDDAIGFFDDMPWEALYAASLAPSYLNRGAYGVVSGDGELSLGGGADAYTTELDGDQGLGIVLHHFTSVAEDWAGKLSWQFGGDASGLALPEGHKLVARSTL